MGYVNICDSDLIDKLFSKASTKIMLAANNREQERLNRLSQCLEREKKNTRAYFDTKKNSVKKKYGKHRSPRERNQILPNLLDKNHSVDFKNVTFHEHRTQRPDRNKKRLDGNGPNFPQILKVETKPILPPIKLSRSKGRNLSRRSSTIIPTIMTPISESQEERPCSSNSLNDRSNTWAPSPDSELMPDTEIETLLENHRTSVCFTRDSRRGSIPTSQPNLDPDDFKTLVLRLHRHDRSLTNPALMTEEEKRIFNFLEGVNRQKKAERRIDKRKVSRVYPEDPVVRLSQVLKEPRDSVSTMKLYEEERKTGKQRYQAPLLLPPIHTVTARPLVPRPDMCELPPIIPLPSTDWEGVRQCRYIRSNSDLSLTQEDVL